MSTLRQLEIETAESVLRIARYKLEAAEAIWRTLDELEDTATENGEDLAGELKLPLRRAFDRCVFLDRKLDDAFATVEALRNAA